MKFCTLFSGSSGNAAYIEHENTRILLDAGQGVLVIKRALAALGREYKDLTAILLTHDHSDHVRGVAPIARRCGVPIYGPRAVLRAMVESSADLMPDRLTAFAGEGPFQIGSLRITPFETPHDATASVGYLIETGDGKRLGVATDLGYVPEPVYDKLAGADFVLIESNYDEELLRRGSYPYPLKQRILSDHGHLSNADCAACICRLCGSGTRHFLLGHLSRENNLPQLAMQAAVQRLEAEGYAPGEVTVDVAPRDTPSRMFEF